LDLAIDRILDRNIRAGLDVSYWACFALAFDLGGVILHLAELYSKEILMKWVREVKIVMRCNLRTAVKDFKGGLNSVDIRPRRRTGAAMCNVGASGLRVVNKPR
jgi:hypothetical protein